MKGLVRVVAWNCFLCWRVRLKLFLFKTLPMKNILNSATYKACMGLKRKEMRIVFVMQEVDSLFWYNTYSWFLRLILNIHHNVVSNKTFFQTPSINHEHINNSTKISSKIPDGIEINTQVRWTNNNKKKHYTVLIIICYTFWLSNGLIQLNSFNLSSWLGIINAKIKYFFANPMMVKLRALKFHSKKFANCLWYINWVVERPQEKRIQFVLSLYIYFLFCYRICLN